MKRTFLLYALPSLLLMVWVVLPIVRGRETLYLRDVLNVHLPVKTAQAEAMRRGYLPLVDRYRAGGQPLLGNPNTVALYPDNLLFLVAPTLWAFNAHFWIHFLVAPFSFFWLARSWGLSPRASWGAALCYGLSGYFLSQLNFYNLVAGVALAPALVAASLSAIGGRPDGATPRPRRGALLAAALLWTLILLAGDPMVAAQALLLAAGAVVIAGGWRKRGTGLLAGSFVCGTLLAAPQLVEFLRILPLSYRGYWGFSRTWALGASWDPRTAFEWIVPFAFGRPEVQFWGVHLFDDHPPLFVTLYPGLLSLALVLSSGRPRSRASWWAWSGIGVGLFLSLGVWNPIVRWAFALPGVELLRFPVKFWLLVAVGSSLLCGIGLERLLRGEGIRPVSAVLGALAVVLLGLWIVLSFVPLGAALLRDLIPPRFDAEFVHGERLRWAGLCLLSLVLLGCLALILRLRRKSVELAGAAAVLLHAAAQLFFLRAAMPTDKVASYQKPPPILEEIHQDELIAHGGYNDMFGEARKSTVKFPDGRLLWVQRRGWNELYPFAGVFWSRRYELNISPEGLDSFLTFAAYQAMRLLDDPERLRILAAFGVDVVVLDRDLDPPALPLVRLRKRLPSFSHFVNVYEILGTAEEVQFLCGVRRAPHMNAALALISDPEFDPRLTVVVPGEGTALDGPPGRVELLARSPESLRVRVGSASPGVLLVQRAHLPLYRATIDGERAPTTVANLSRLAVEVPAGEHEVHLWVDRTPGYLSLAGIPLALVVLAWVWRRASAGD